MTNFFSVKERKLKLTEICFQFLMQESRLDYLFNKTHAAINSTDFLNSMINIIFSLIVDFNVRYKIKGLDEIFKI